MFFNGFISTPPSEITLSLAGILSSTTDLTFTGVLISGTLGNFSGMYLPYFIGRWIGYQWLLDIKTNFANKGKFKKWVSNYIPSEKVLLLFAEKFRGNGAIWVGIFRFFPLVRSTITSLPAGVVKMPHLKFSFYSLIGIIIWVVFWSSIGFFIGESWHQIKTIGSVILIAVLLGIIYYLKIVAQRYIEKNLGK
jgi:membrane protein DedA with SNARE-associated domain